MTMNWTLRTRRTLVERFPAEQLLPDRLPAYVRSSVYLLGMISVAALGVIFLSGIILILGGIQWWHTSSAGHFFNSLHFWSMQIFFFSMVLHLWAQFFMGAWRDGRAWTWFTGVLAFLVSIPAAFTGYVSQTNFDAQWIALSAKDAFNSVGLGGVFNVLNLGQMLGLHILFFPLIVALLVGGHLLQVRMRGVVHPYPPDEPPAAEQARGEGVGQ